MQPSILPAFKRLDVYQRVIERGVDESGATLHRIKGGGEIIDQITCHLRENKNMEELKRYASKYEAQIVRTNLGVL